MPKDINIHLKTKGARQTKDQLDQVAGGAIKVGTEAKGMGDKAEKGSGKLVKMLGKLVGPLGFAAVAAAIAGAARKVAAFFDEIKKRSDEAVRNLQDLRQGYEDLFEAVGAFDEKSREAVTKQTNLLLQKTSVTKDLGLPIIDAYTRQFRLMVDTGKLSQEQYERGLEGMLSYGARHGGAATADLIAMMAGWGMETPEQQGAFRRQIAEGAEAVGLKDKDIIGALGRGMPTIKAMGWTPEDAVQAIGTIAAGEVGRKRMALPGTTLQAIMAPQEAKLAEYGIEEKLVEQPRQLLERIAGMREGMDQQRFVRMLTGIYGTEGAAGVYKLIAERRQDLADTLTRAAGEEGIAAEQAEEQAYRDTLEARDARAKARKRLIALRVTEDEKYMEDVREIGAESRKLLGRREAISMELREIFLGKREAAEAEYGAYREWLESLGAEEQAEVEREIEALGAEGLVGGPPSRFRMGAVSMPKRRSPYLLRWQAMTPREKFEALTTQEVSGPPVSPEPEVLREPEMPGPVPTPEPRLQPAMKPALQVSAAQAPVVYDNRTINYTIFNPLSGMNKVDLLIEPPRLT